MNFIDCRIFLKIWLLEHTFLGLKMEQTFDWSIHFEGGAYISKHAGHYVQGMQKNEATSVFVAKKKCFHIIPGAQHMQKKL